MAHQRELFVERQRAVLAAGYEQRDEKDDDDGDTVVTSLISQDEAQTAEIDELLDKRFDGSLPAFVAAFTKSSHVSDKELDEVQKMIDLYRKENHHG